MRLYTIKSIDGGVLFECSASSLQVALEAAFEQGASLFRADLRGQRLCDAGHMPWAADALHQLRLSGADLRGADLRGASAPYADFTGADLWLADLGGADLRYANLIGARLDGANFAGADLRGAMCADGPQDKYRDSLWALLDRFPDQAGGLAALIAAGQIDGQSYEGPCTGLAGSIANLRGVADAVGFHMELGDWIGSANVWFQSIKPGDTPDNNAAAATVAEWIEEWQQRQSDARNAANGAAP